MPTKKPAPEPVVKAAPAKPRSSKNWKVTDTSGMTDIERKEHTTKMLAEGAKKARPTQKVNNVSQENEKVLKKPRSDKQTVKSDGKQAEKPAKRGPGNVSTYSEAMAANICDLIAEGVPLREICRLDGLPAWRTVYDWQKAHPDFAARIAGARDLGEEAIFQDCLRIADTPLIGEEVEESENGLKIKRGDMLGHRKLQIETRLKLLAKWNPRKWGDKVDVNHGVQPENPLASLMAQLAGKTLKPVANPEEDE